MDKLCELIKQANDIIININPTQKIINLETIVYDQNIQITILSNQINKLNLELESNITEIKQKNEEINNFTKVSIIKNITKQLEDKNSYIQILESQIEKFKKNPHTDKLIDSEESKIIKEVIIIKKDIEQPFIKEKVKKKSVQPEKESSTKIIEEYKNDSFNPDDFIEINGFELMVYRKKYYLRDLETNQLFDIKDNKSNKFVGIYTTNGKVKLN